MNPEIIKTKLVKTRKQGNSLVYSIPSEIVKMMDLKENDELKIMLVKIERKHPKTPILLLEARKVLENENIRPEWIDG